jgi:hypothetical protein
MTFGPEMFEAVLDGRKTVTRRLNCPYQPGRDYAIQPGRGQLGVEGKRMRVLRVRRELLAWACDEAEARREGFRSVEDFVAYWRRMNRGRWDPTALLWRIEFEVIDA